MSKLVEEWRPVAGYEGLYEVSDWGNVRSVDRVVEFFHPLAKKITKRFFQGKVLKKVLNNDGYHVVSLSDSNSKQHEGKVHRLVAEAFIPNPENKPQVGHLKTMENGLEDKTANEVWNLSWMDSVENANYGTLRQRLSEHMIGEKNPMKRKDVASKVAEKQREIGKKRWIEHREMLENFMNSDKHNEKLKIKVNQYDKITDCFIQTWDSAADAERELHIFASNIRACCKGKNKTAGGYKWSYYDNRGKYKKD